MGLGLTMALALFSAAMSSGHAGATLDASATAHAEAPRPYHAEYEARSHGMSSTAIRELRHSGDGLYRISQGLEVRVLGARLIAVDETSHFAWVEDQAIPAEYRYRQRGISRRDERLSFDWSEMMLEYEDRSTSGSMPIERGQLDPLGFSVQLSADVKAARLAQNDRNDFIYRIVDVDDRDEHLYRIMGEEMLKTPAGELKTLRIERIREPGASRSTVIWLASEHDYILARLEQTTRSGNTTELALKSVEWR